MLDALPADDIGIVAIAYELPGAAVDIVDYARAEALPDDLLERLLANGVRWFYDGSDRSDASLIGGAIDRLVAERGTAWLREVDVLIHARSQAFSTPAAPISVVGELAASYGMNPAWRFSVEQIACAGVVQAIRWASRLLAADPALRYALVVTSDRVFGNAKHRVRQDAGVQSDGGSAILIGRSDLLCRIGSITMKTYGDLHEGPSTPTLAAALARSTCIQTRQAIAEHAAQAGQPIASYARILPVNADRHYWLQIAKGLGVGPERMFLDNIGLRGHACSNDLAINLVDAGLAEIRRGGAVLYCGQSNLGVYAQVTFAPPTVAGHGSSSDVGIAACKTLELA